MMSISSRTGILGSRAAVAKLHLQAHCGSTEGSFLHFVWFLSICKGSKNNENAFIYLNILWFPFFFLNATSFA